MLRKSIGTMGGRLPERRRVEPTDEYTGEPDPDRHYEAAIEEGR